MAIDNKFTTLSVVIPKKTHQQVKEIAYQDGVFLKQIFLEALEIYIEKRRLEGSPDPKI